MSDIEFTYRQKEVIESLADGRTNQEIAEHLGITEKTVKNHIAAIMQKIDATNRVQIAKYYYENMR